MYLVEKSCPNFENSQVRNVLFNDYLFGKFHFLSELSIQKQTTN